MLSGEGNAQETEMVRVGRLSVFVDEITIREWEELAARLKRLALSAEMECQTASRDSLCGVEAMLLQGRL